MVISLHYRKIALIGKDEHQIKPLNKVSDFTGTLASIKSFF